ncbi:MAG: helicase, partial [Bradyrhizobium sp.]|nr:helicase [Bradyrhizobium sp.]
HWQGIAREVENKLSDALHERLTERFVDRRTSVLMRRLRENSVLNTEIGKTGEVIVEGHVIGRLDGFTFAPDAAEAGSDAKALQATALKALAGEIDARAEKLAAAPDEQFVLTSDGTIRWTGDAVARLVAADDALHPRLRIISDDRLAGAPREAVQTRLDLWLKTHIEKLLGPLFDLQKAEDITGIARGIAFQLIEALGVLERQKISAEMKDLDQPSRATLRKYGVRFGAYHIYVPALLKPAARALASLLWAEKQSNVDMSALSGAQHLAGSGRTSFPVDKSLDRDAYRVLGYRQCGERAVRVDILERLADLIRPALSWREASPGTKPAGAFDGRGFVVTQAMTSLTGSAGEDFASILRALGYRMEKKAPLPPKPVVVEAPAAEAAAAEPASDVVAQSTETAQAGSDLAPAAEDATASSATLLPDIAFSPAPEPAEPVAVEAAQPEPVAVVEALEAPAVETVEAPVEAPMAEAVEAPVVEAVEAAAVEAPQEQAAAESTTETVAAVDAAADGSVAEATAPEVAAVPEMVEVWRPGGRSEERRPRHDRNRQRHQDRPAQGADAAAAVPGEAGDAAKGERHRRGRRTPDFRRPRTDAPPADGATPVVAADGAPASPPREDRGGRPPRERFQGKGRDNDRPQGRPEGKPQDRSQGKPPGKFGGGDRDKGGRDKGGRDKGGFGGKGGRDSGPSHRQWATSAAPAPRERDRPVDPNSPFAKLAALKEQLAANRKD